MPDVEYIRFDTLDSQDALAETEPQDPDEPIDRIEIFNAYGKKVWAGTREEYGFAVRVIQFDSGLYREYPDAMCDEDQHDPFTGEGNQTTCRHCGAVVRWTMKIELGGEHLDNGAPEESAGREDVQGGS